MLCMDTIHSLHNSPRPKQSKHRNDGVERVSVLHLGLAQESKKRPRPSKTRQQSKYSPR
jgi:hypothetical protein